MNTDLEFHSMMHRAGTKECRAQYGGTFHHLVLRWEFRGRDWIKRITLCRIGIHKDVLWTKFVPLKTEYMACLYCCREVRYGDVPKL